MIQSDWCLHSEFITQNVSVVLLSWRFVLTTLTRTPVLYYYRSHIYVLCLMIFFVSCSSSLLPAHDVLQFDFWCSRWKPNSLSVQLLAAAERGCGVGISDGSSNTAGVGGAFGGCNGEGDDSESADDATRHRSPSLTPNFFKDFAEPPLWKQSSSACQSYVIIFSGGTIVRTCSALRQK